MRLPSPASVCHSRSPKPGAIGRSSPSPLPPQRAATRPSAHLEESSDSRRCRRASIWRARARYRDLAGHLRAVEARGRSGAAAQRALEDKLHQASTETAVAGTATITPATRMGVVFDHWLAEKRVEGQITMQSLETYRGVLERDLRPAFGLLDTPDRRRSSMEEPDGHTWTA